MQIPFFVFVALAITACTDNTNTTTEDRTDSTVLENPDTNKSFLDTSSDKPGKEPSAIINVNGCYWEVLQRDTLAIKLNQTGIAVTGKLTFDNYQKDGSSGAVRGTVEGDIIKLWYNFASEGMNSVMEIYFKKQDGQLLRGIGPVDAKGDSSYYTDHTAIKYSQDQSFTKLPCEDLPGKYK